MLNLSITTMAQTEVLAVILHHYHTIVAETDNLTPSYHWTSHTGEDSIINSEASHIFTRKEEKKHHALTHAKTSNPAPSENASRGKQHRPTTDYCPPHTKNRPQQQKQRPPWFLRSKTRPDQGPATTQTIPGHRTSSVGYPTHHPTIHTPTTNLLVPPPLTQTTPSTATVPHPVFNSNVPPPPGLTNLISQVVTDILTTVKQQEFFPPNH